jgi:predicted nuclease with TOPRIM domain
MRTTIDDLVADRAELTTKVQALEREKGTLHKDPAHEKNIANDVEGMRHVIHRLEDDRNGLRKRLDNLGETIELRTASGDKFL